MVNVLCAARFLRCLCNPRDAWELRVAFRGVCGASAFPSAASLYAKMPAQSFRPLGWARATK